MMYGNSMCGHSLEGVASGRLRVPLQGLDSQNDGLPGDLPETKLVPVTKCRGDEGALVHLQIVVGREGDQGTSHPCQARGANAEELERLRNWRETKMCAYQ